MVLRMGIILIVSSSNDYMSTTKLYVISNPHDDIYGEQHKGTETAVAVSASLNRCYTSFFQALTASTGQQLTTGEKCQIMDGLQPIKLRRRQYFLQEGDVCRRLGFIIQGAVRTYAVNHKGQESILYFNTERNWLGDLESFRTSQASRYHIEALEHTELLTASHHHIASLSIAIPAFRQFLEQEYYVRLAFNQCRVHMALSMNAEERYLDLLKNQPEYAKRFSQNTIASYLGIKPETLSRIRRNWQGR